MQIKLNNRYMDVKIRNEYNELTVNFIDSDLIFLMKWLNKIHDPINGKICKKIDCVEDIHFKRNSDDRFYLTTRGIIRNCWISELDMDNKIFILTFDYMDNNYNYNPIMDRLNKLYKIKQRIENKTKNRK